MRDSFAIKWSFHTANNTILVDDLPLFKLRPQTEHESTSPHTQHQASVVVADVTEIVLPWSNLADATLVGVGVMPGSSPGSESALLLLQITRQRNAEDGTITYKIFPAIPAASVKAANDLPPLVSLEYSDPAASTSAPRFYFPQGPVSASPSTTLPIRRAILRVLAHVAFIVKFAALAGMNALIIAFWVSVTFLLWAISFGSLKSWRKGFVERVSKATTDTSETREISSATRADKQRTEPADKMV